ncbi:MAG TPA: DUF1080 domain-containing protein, partial [Sphingobacteriaceae bacterium]|nr:DUF1080 domain-containing protein [Sphingobacteriaceae bacterium]
MKLTSIATLFLIVSALLFSSYEKKKEITPPKTDISEFLGQWGFDIKAGGIGWLDIRQENGYIDADVLFQGGSIVPATSVYLAADVLYLGRGTRKIIRTKDASGVETRSMMFPGWMEIKKTGNKITGYYITPKSNGIGADSSYFSGSKMPPMVPAPDLSKVKYGKPIQLFNGKDLTGWRPFDPKLALGFKVVDGTLMNNPVQTLGQAHVGYTNLRTDKEFEDFNLKLEVNVPARSNSGIYLRGMYEVQVEEGHIDSHGKNLDSHNIGGLYSRISPTVNAEKPAGTWQTMDITLVDRHVTVILNGTKIIDNQPVDGPTGGAISTNVNAPGPLILQGDHSIASYRNIV